PPSSARRRLPRWPIGFAPANAALFAIVGLRYLWLYSPLAPLPGWTYAGLAFVGHLSAVAYAPLVLLAPVMLLLPWPRLIVPLAVSLATILLSFLLLDSLVFAENRYHLGFLPFRLRAPRRGAFCFLCGSRGGGGGGLVALWVGRRIARPPPRRIDWYAPLALGVCLRASTPAPAWAGPHY